MWTDRIVSSTRPAGTPEPEAGAGALWARAAEGGASRASAAPAARMVMLRCDIGRVLPFLDVSGGAPDRRWPTVPPGSTPPRWCRAPPGPATDRHGSSGSAARLSTVTGIPITVYGDVDDRAVEQLTRCAEAGDALRGVLCADGHVGY